MKFHWGHGITVFFVLFVATLIFVLIASMRVDHALVYDDYYAKDLAYQEYYDKAKAGNKYQGYAFKHDVNSKVVNITFSSDKNISGTVTFYRPSAKDLDFEVDLSGKETTIPVQAMTPGKWKVTVEWIEAGKKYLREEQVFI